MFSPGFHLMFRWAMQQLPSVERLLTDPVTPDAGAPE
jgi:hypothetical protein